MKLVSTLTSLVLVLPLFTACGSRGPLDVAGPEPTPGNPDDAGLDGVALDDGAARNDASTPPGEDGSLPPGVPDASPDGPRRRRDGGVASDASLPPDAGPPGTLSCATCVGQQCGTQVLQCFQNPSCRMTLQCVLTTCGGALDPQCLFGCANNDPSQLGAVLGVVQCIATQCAAECANLQMGMDGG